MNERSAHSTALLKLVLDFGESVEVDGSTIHDPIDDRPVPAVVFRMPAHRAAYFGQALAAHTQMCRLAGVPVADHTPAWALTHAAAAAGYTGPGAPPSRTPDRAAAAAVLRATTTLDDTTTIAIVDAAAWWLTQPHGPDHAWSLLGTVTPDQTQAYAALLGTSPT